MISYRPYASYAAAAMTELKYPLRGPRNGIPGSQLRMFHHAGHSAGMTHWFKRGAKFAKGPRFVPSVSLLELNKAIIQLAQRHRPSAVAVLHRFGVNNTPSLKPELYGAVFAAAREAFHALPMTLRYGDVASVYHDGTKTYYEARIIRAISAREAYGAA